MEGGWSRSRGLAVLMVLIMCLLTAAAVLATMRREVCVLVRSDPPRASVFHEGTEIGATPVRLILARGERRSIRLVRRGCLDAERRIAADDYIPRVLTDRLSWIVKGGEGEVMVRLVAAASATLVVTSDPAGAGVFLDGRRAGITPFSRDGLAPGRRTLRIEHPECFAETIEVALKPGETRRVHRILKSRVAALYRDLIAGEPGSLLHHSDLAHYYVLQGEVDHAMAALRGGLEALRRTDATDKGRYFSELWKIYRRMYAYPRETGKSRLRPLCLELMQTALDQKLGNAKQLRNYLKGMKDYGRQHPEG